MHLWHFPAGGCTQVAVRPAARPCPNILAQPIFQTLNSPLPATARALHLPDDASSVHRQTFESEEVVAASLNTVSLRQQPPHGGSRYHVRFWPLFLRDTKFFGYSRYPRAASSPGFLVRLCFTPVPSSPAAQFTSLQHYPARLINRD